MSKHRHHDKPLPPVPVTHDTIAVAAYYIWQHKERHHIHNTAFDNWIEAVGQFPISQPQYD